MNEFQIKRHFERKGKKIVDIVKDMHDDFPDVKLTACDVMLRQLIAGQRWYPKYAQWLKTRYGVSIQKPEWIRSVRQRMKLAA